MIVILDNLRSAFNVGSIIRTCDAIGIKEIYFCGITPDPSNKKVLKTSLGAEKNIKTHIIKSTTDALYKLRDEYEIVGLELSNSAIDIQKYKPSKSIALILGNEVSGLNDELIRSCDVLVKIPMMGVKESLNVSVAFGIAGFVLSGLE